MVTDEVIITLRSKEYILKDDLLELLIEEEGFGDASKRSDFLRNLMKMADDKAEVEMEVELPIDKLLEDIGQSNCDGDVERWALDRLSKEDVEDEAVSVGLLPMLAEDFNDYDFRRKMCDLFQLGYHAPGEVLISEFVKRIDSSFGFIL